MYGYDKSIIIQSLIINMLARFTDAANQIVTDEVVKAVRNERTSATLARSK